MTNKGKIEHYDAVSAQLAKLQLAVFDLTCNTKFPFVDRVRVNGAKEIDETFRCVVRVSVSRRAMPVYMVEFMDIDGYNANAVGDVQFWTEDELDDNRENTDTFLRVLRHARWKIGQAAKLVSPEVSK